MLCNFPPKYKKKKLIIAHNFGEKKKLQKLIQKCQKNQRAAKSISQFIFRSESKLLNGMRLMIQKQQKLQNHIVETAENGKTFVRGRTEFKFRK